MSARVALNGVRELMRAIAMPRCEEPGREHFAP